MSSPISSDIYIHPSEKEREDFWIDFLNKPERRFFLKLHNDGSISSSGNFVIRPFDLVHNNTAFEIEHIPFKFKNVKRNFIVSGLKLKSLEGSPDTCGNFIAFRNNLVDLKGGPRYVEGFYQVSHSQLLTLEGAPERASFFDCSDNFLKRLDHCPPHLDGLDCSANRITTLIGAPEIIRYFDCSDNELEDIKGCPLFVDKVPSINPSAIVFKTNLFSKDSFFRLSTGFLDNDLIKNYEGIKNMPNILKAPDKQYYGIKKYLEDRSAIEKLEGDAQNLYGDVFSDF